MIYIYIILLTLILSIVRISGHKSQAFQALAHLWVGILIGLAVGNILRQFIIYNIVALSIIELICFIKDHRR